MDDPEVGADPSPAARKTYTVYRVDYLNNTRTPIGTITERRHKERRNNGADMLRLAQKLYADSSIDKLHIIVSPD